MRSDVPPAVTRTDLEGLYARFNRRSMAHPDPIEFLYRYEDVADREIAGFLASSLAYGRVAQILRSVSLALDKLGPPAQSLKCSSRRTLRAAFRGYRHRFATGEQVASLLHGLKRVIERYGSLHACFTAGLTGDHETVLPALTAFVDAVRSGAGTDCGHLLPSPVRGSACKRLNLFLRWMVRRDDVDPGGWDGIPPLKLIVPIDTHMFRICRALGFTQRNQADMRAALEITSAFRAFAPEDPVRYDFALSRLGIRRDADPAAFLASCGVAEVA